MPWPWRKYIWTSIQVSNDNWVTCAFTSCYFIIAGTYCHHNPAWQTESSGSRTQRCCTPSSSAHTRWPHAAQRGRCQQMRWCAHSARPRCLWDGTLEGQQWWGNRRSSSPAGWAGRGWSWCEWRGAGPYWIAALQKQEIKLMIGWVPTTIY